MKLLNRKEISPIILPGRKIWKAIGKDALSKSGKMTYGFAHFCADYGPVEPHRHAEEICYVLNAEKAWVRYGPEKDKLGPRHALEAGMTIHTPPMEWHVFGYEEGGYLDILFFYGQVDNIRPEETD